MIETLVRRVLESLLLTESNTVSKRFINMYASVRIVLDPLLQGLVTVLKNNLSTFMEIRYYFWSFFFSYIYRAPVSRAHHQGTQPQQTTSGSATHAHTWSAVLFDWSHTTQNPRQLADLRT